MSRLTIKTDKKYITDDTKCMNNKYITKLGKLEDLEEELGCPLEVVINACINGFIAKYYGDWENEELHIDKDIVADFRRKCFTDNYANEYFWKDYKKTWWLREDKSE